MHRTSAVVLVALGVVGAAGLADAFLQDLLLQPLQQLQHAVQPQPQPQYYPNQYQYQYRRAVSDAPQSVQSLQHGVYAKAQPVLYQWLPSSSSSPAPTSYGSGYAYGSNPFASLLQTSWLPWAANRQPQLQQQQQQQQQQVQQLQLQPQQVQLQPQQVQHFSAPAAASQPPQQLFQQQLQPLQAFWALLPWNNINSNSNNGGGASGPVLSFLQNPSALLPWAQQGQQASRPGVVYTTPLSPAPSPAPAPLGAAPAFSSLHVVPEAAPAPATPGPASSAAGVVPLEDVLGEDVASPSALAAAGNRRVALHQAAPHDGLPCA